VPELELEPGQVQELVLGLGLEQLLNTTAIQVPILQHDRWMSNCLSDFHHHLRPCWMFQS
jgi:hypothetical protein